MAETPPTTGAATSGPTEDGERPAQQTILVIDDEPGIRRGCRRVLQAEGHNVLLAETAEEGLATLAAQPHTMLALVDLKMPGMGGLEFLDRVRDVAPETVFVVITAYATLETAIEATKRGAYDFLAKPFTPDELLRVVNKSLERGQLFRDRNRLQAERERRLLELATEKGRLRTVINCMADAVLVCNAEEELVLHNPAALRVLRDPDAAQEAHPLEQVIRLPQLLAAIREVSRNHRRLSQEIPLSDPAADDWVLASVAPVLDDSSRQLLGTVTVLRDITKLKRVEQVKAQFVNMVAHELRAPLAAVDGYITVMLEGLTPDPEKQKQILGRSHERLQALLDLVDDLLNVARIEARAVRRDIAAQSVPQIVDEVVELMHPLAAQKQVEIRTELDPDLPTVEADREELIRLLNNLVSNAVKYNREHGQVIVKATQDGPYVKIAVQDNGLGISEKGRRRLFKEFFREKTPATTHVTGTGLGLSIVKRIVDFYHGRIEVDSELDKGSTFTVWLPCKFEQTKDEQ